MKRNLGFSLEFLYQVVSLIVIVILVHAAYVGIIRPRGDAILAQQAAAMEKDKSAVTERSIYVLIYDWEQEAAIILALWAFAIMGFKWILILRQRALLNQDFIPLAEGVRILPEDTRELARQVQALPDPERRAGRTNRRRLCRALRPQAMVHCDRLNLQPRGQTQTQKGGGIPTARQGHPDHLPLWQALTDQPDQPRFVYWHANPCIATLACVAAMLPG